MSVRITTRRPFVSSSSSRNRSDSASTSAERLRSSASMAKNLQANRGLLRFRTRVQEPPCEKFASASSTCFSIRATSRLTTLTLGKNRVRVRRSWFTGCATMSSSSESTVIPSNRRVYLFAYF